MDAKCFKLSQWYVKCLLLVLFYYFSYSSGYAAPLGPTMVAGDMKLKESQRQPSTYLNGSKHINEEEMKLLFEDMLEELTVQELRLKEAVETINALSAVNERVLNENRKLHVELSEREMGKHLLLSVGLVSGIILTCLVGGPIVYGMVK